MQHDTQRPLARTNDPLTRVTRALPLASAALAGTLALLAPRTAAAVQGAELYRNEAAFYGKYEARVRFAPGEGVVSSFFLWKDGSSSTTTWNELDYEKINGNCRLQTNIWTGKGTQSAVVTTPSFDICADYHTYAFEWTPDYIRWSIDGTELRKVTGASVTEYTQNASKGMAMHFNLWAGDSSFGGNFNASVLPVRQYVNWAQYSAYANGAFQMKWREDFTGNSLPDGWGLGDWNSPANHSKHNPANVSFVNGIAILSMTADNATGYTGTPPADASDPAPSGTGGAPGTGGSGTGGSATGGTGPGTGGVAATGGRVGAGGSTTPRTGGTSATGGSGTGTGGVATSTGGASSTGGSSTTGGTSATGGVGQATGGAPGTGGTPPGTGGSDQDAAGCNCRVGGDELSRGGLSLAGLLVVASLVRRRSSRPRG